MNSTQLAWKRAADELGFKVETPFATQLPSGQVVEAEILAHGFGGKRGNLIFTDYDKVQPFADELLSAGYFFSVVGGSIPNEEFDIENYIDVLSDWGWAGDERDRPNWLRDPPEYEEPT
ncbi:MAG: hypothetical protein WCH44_17545 [Betaproteobacteria bacterium]